VYNQAFKIRLNAQDEPLIGFELIGYFPISIVCIQRKDDKCGVSAYFILI
jgi:hypothetical protein